MTKYIARRFLLIIFVLFGVSVITFGIMQLVPGDPAEIIAITKYGRDVDPSQVALVAGQYGLAQPLHVQYMVWLGQILKGNLGYSYVLNGPVLDEILARFPATFQLALLAVIISTLVAVPLGVISAVKRNTVIDYACTTLSLISLCTPAFWLALILILVFAVNLQILPVCGYGGIRHVILPALSLAAGYVAMTMRLMRVSMIEVLSQDYVLVARAKGLREKLVLLRHALKNALIPVITVIGLQFGHLLEGAVVIETVFGWPGIGKLMIDSIYARDYPVILGCVMFIGTVYSLINLMVDLAYFLIDPRVRLGDAR